MGRSAVGSALVFSEDDMRFRVPNTGGQQAADGIGNFFRAMALAPLQEAQAAEEAQTAGMKRDLIGAQTGLANANIGRVLAEAAIKQQEAKTLEGRPDVLNLMGATRAGMSVPEFQAGVNERKYGAPAVGPALLPQPIEGVGPSGRTAAFDDAILTLFGPAMATPADKTNWDQIANARGEYRNQDLRDSVLSGRVDPARAGAAQAAVAGKPMISNIGTSGAGFNVFTGEGKSLNPGMEVLFGDQGRAGIALDQARAGASLAQAGASKASAANSYAAAGQHRAATDKIRRDIELGEKGTLQQTDQGLALVNPRTGTATLVTGPGGKPFGNSVAAGYTKMTEGQAKANLFGQRMAESNRILDDMAARGTSKPGQIKRAADAVPLIGAGLGTIVNSLPTWMGAPNSDQQQVEQAQRDFVNAVLRRESGAVISEGEFTNAAQQYFPQPGDAPAVIEQKRRNRQRATELMLMEVPDAVRARGAAPIAAQPQQPQSGDGYTGSWGAPATPGRTVTVDY